MAGPGVLTASTAATATLCASSLPLAVLSGSTGAGTPGGYPATYGPTYAAAAGALILTGTTAP